MSLTETESLYHDLEKMSVHDLLTHINTEDTKVPLAVAKQIPALEKMVTAIVEKIQEGGRLFYMGAGTSGRLGVVDASECPPTYGVPQDMVIALIAGGDSAIRHSAEKAEDSTIEGWSDLQAHSVSSKDFVIGIAASGRTPYVVSALAACRAKGISTGCIVCNASSAVAAQADFPVEILVGPEFVTGSTRMKAGTAQKLALNMISTAVMIRLGRVKGNRMVHMQLSNDKLVDRGTQMVVAQTALPYDVAKKILLEHGSVAAAVSAHHHK